MPTKNILKISPNENQEEIDVELIENNICLSTSYNEYPVFLQLSIADWDSLKKYIDFEISKRIGRNG